MQIIFISFNTLKHLEQNFFTLELITTVRTAKSLFERLGALFFNPSPIVAFYSIRGGVQLEGGALFFD